MAIKHAFRRNEKVISMYGELEFNDHGFLINGEDLEASDEQLLELPNIVDGATFKGDQISPVEVDEDPASGSGLPVSEDPSDEEYGAYILELESETGESHVNTEGYLDMDFLNGKLREKDWPILSGGKRKKITDVARENVKK